MVVDETYRMLQTGLEMIDIIKETSDDMHGTATKQERGTSDYKV